MPAYPRFIVLLFEGNRDAELYFLLFSFKINYKQIEATYFDFNFLLTNRVVNVIG